MVVDYSGNHEAARETVATIEAASGRAVAVQVDVGKVGDIQRLFDAAFRTTRANQWFSNPVAADRSVTLDIFNYS